MDTVYDNGGREIPIIGEVYGLNFQGRVQSYVVRLLVFENGVLEKVVLFRKHSPTAEPVYLHITDWYELDPWRVNR